MHLTPTPSDTRSWDALRRPIWMFDPHSLRGIYANDAAVRLWGAESRDELLSRDFSQLSRTVLLRTARLAQATKNGEEVSERWTFYPNGRPVTVQATISTYRLEDGRPVLLFEASPAEVEAAERRAVEALRHTSTLISLFDQEGSAMFVNPAAFAAYGPGEHAFNARFADPQRGPRILAQALAGETVAEVCETTTTGGRRWHHLDARPVTDPVTGLVGVLLNERDVTARVEAERGRAAAEQKAAMAEARQRFLADMSHELRTPLNAVIGFSELLAVGGLPPEPAEQARRIHQSGQQLLAVVDEMIRLSQMDGWAGERSDWPAAPKPAPEAAGPAASPVEGRATRVLCVEDNPHNQALVTAMLAAQGLECVTANDGAEGVAAAGGGGWDLILMDIQMPVLGGVEATRAIRAMSGPAAGVPIIAVTANTLPEQLKDYQAAGIDDVIAKPVRMADLIGKVVAWIGAERPGAGAPGSATALAS